MRWIEVISARGFTDVNPAKMERLFEDMRRSITTDSKDIERVVVYSGVFVDSDWAIHLHWDTDRRQPGKTGLGAKLSELIRPMALVDHDIWLERSA